jgi:hypothetical protein
MKAAWHLGRSPPTKARGEGARYPSGYNRG